MHERELVMEGDPDCDAAKEFSAKICDAMKGANDRIVVLAAVRFITCLASSLYEDTEDRIAYTREFCEAVTETIQFNATGIN